MPPLAQGNEKMNLTSAKLVWHFSNSQSTKWQELIMRQHMAFRPYY